MAPAAFALPSRLLPSQAPFSTGSVFSAKHDTQRKKEQGAHKSGQGKRQQLLRIRLLAYDLPLKTACSG